ncbi:MAG: helix-turn-helix transcriptional regulator [Oscillospiraceae bacterium]|nr:helix-turn-helix transcriptional regulator [Oscillospiraceae bacterium]
MANKTLAALIKEARTKAGLTQEALAKQVDNCSAGDISKAEHAEKDLTTAQLKQIAKACGVTQKSLLEAAGTTGSTAAKTTAAKTGTAKTTAAKTAEKKTSSAKTASAAKTADEAIKLTAAEKKLLELYRAANAETRKNAVAVLKGEATIDQGLLGNLLNSATSEDGLLGNLLNSKGGEEGGLLGNLLGSLMKEKD